MGLPEGWVTDARHQLTPAKQLEALGNGVVPAQASLGLRLLDAAVPLSCRTPANPLWGRTP